MSSFPGLVRALISTLCTVGVTACATVQVGSDYYRGADLSGYGSFAWVDESPLIQSESRRVDVSPLNVRRIREAIERELNAKGFDLVSDREDADFSISFTVGARDMIRVDDYPMFYRGRWRWQTVYYWPNVDIDMYTEGMLAIDIFDNSQREPVWHGWARKRIVGADVENPQATINEVVQAIFRDFPPS